MCPAKCFDVKRLANMFASSILIASHLKGPAGTAETWESLAKAREQQIAQLKQALEEAQSKPGGGSEVPEEFAELHSELEASRRYESRCALDCLSE